MGQYLLEGPHMPPLEMFWFLVPLALQCLLLHPVFSPAFSRFARLSLLAPSMCLSFRTPYNYAIEPRNQAIGLNFVIGIMSGYGVWKSLEWGLAEDLLPYTWVGFDEPGEASENGEAKNGRAAAKGTGPDKKDVKKEAKKRRIQRKREHLETLRRQQDTDSPWQIVKSTLHLLYSMRGNGYVFGTTSTDPFPLEPRPFLRRLLLEIAWSHPLLVFCAALLLEPTTSRDAYAYALFPSFPVEYAHLVGEGVTGLSMGIAVFAALTLGYSVATLLVFSANHLLRRLPIPSALKPPPFDAREYPPLFNFAEIPSSVAVFWSKQWHSFFSRPFRFLAFDPAQRMFGKTPGRVIGVLGVFALSAWIHEFGLSTATSALPSSELPLSFLLRYGGSVYFMAQGVAIILEGLFTASTGRKTGGWIGTLWATLWIIACGRPLYRAWLTQGLVREVPPMRYWGWQRFILPLGCLQPPPIWMNSLPEWYDGC
ncbi:hypothetical protein JCM21900_003658 [Sporobolomyces salmonicolor]